MVRVDGGCAPLMAASASCKVWRLPCTRSGPPGMSRAGDRKGAHCGLGPTKAGGWLSTGADEEPVSRFTQIIRTVLEVVPGGVIRAGKAAWDDDAHVGLLARRRRGRRRPLLRRRAGVLAQVDGDRAARAGPAVDAGGRGRGRPAALDRCGRRRHRVPDGGRTAGGTSSRWACRRRTRPGDPARSTCSWTATSARRCGCGSSPSGGAALAGTKVLIQAGKGATCSRSTGTGTSGPGGWRGVADAWDDTDAVNLRTANGRYLAKGGRLVRGVPRRTRSPP